MHAAPYLLSLCDLVKTSHFSLGVVSRLHTHKLTFNIEAASLIHSIVTYSPASESVAIEFLYEFTKVSGMNHLVMPVVTLQSELGAEEWAQDILAFLRNRETDTLKAELKPVLDLATEYLHHLLIATRNPGGEKTPQVSTPPTPDINRLREIKELLVDAVINRQQSPLKELIFRRDGYNCPFTGFPFQKDEEGPGVIPRCVHILPFSFHEKPMTLCSLETFAGHAVVAEVVSANINSPRNAFNAQKDAHDYFDQLAWGIEAQQQPGGECRYIYHQVRKKYAYTIKHRDGDEITFGQGEDGRMIDPSDPLFCNLKLAIARVMYACGASGLIDELYGDGDDDEAIVTACLLGWTICLG